MGFPKCLVTISFLGPWAVSLLLCRCRPRWSRRQSFRKSHLQSSSSLQILPQSRPLTWTWWSWRHSSWLGTGGSSWLSWCRRSRGTTSLTSFVPSTVSLTTSLSWLNSTQRYSWQFTCPGDSFSSSTDFWRVLKPDKRARLAIRAGLGVRPLNRAL